MAHKWISRLQWTLLLALTTIPVYLMCGEVWYPQRLLLWYLPSMLYWVLALLCLLPPARLRLPVGILCAVLFAGACLLVMPWQGHILLLVFLLANTVLLLFFLPMGGWTAEMEIPPPVPIAGTITYILIALYTSVLPQNWVHVQPHLIGSFLLYLWLIMLYMNRISLNQAMVDGRHRPSAVLKSRNLLLTGISFVAVVLVACIPLIGRALQSLWDWLCTAIAWFVQLLNRLGKSESAGAGSGGGVDFSGLEEAAETSAFAKLLEAIFRVIAIAATIVLAIAALVFLIKRLIKLLKKLNERLRLFSNAVQDDFEDVTIDTRTEDDRNTSRHGFLNRKAKKIDLASLPPREKIRAVYRGLRSRHAEWSAGSTARESLPEQAATLYEKARYSTHEIAADEAERFISQTSKI